MVVNIYKNTNDDVLMLVFYVIKIVKGMLRFFFKFFFFSIFLSELIIIHYLLLVEQFD